METCYKCGTTYHGSTCPGCAAAENNETLAREQQEHAERLAAEHAELAERLAARQEAAVQEAALRMEQASEEAARENRRTVSEAWKLQANAKADRAFELYEAQMYDEAVVLAQQAIEQDPGNLKAYTAASWGLIAKGSPEAARPFLQTSIGLLGTSDYRLRAEAFLSVLSGIPAQDAELHASFSQTFRSAVSAWPHTDSKLRETIGYLAKHGHREDSRFLVAVAAKKQSPSPLWLLEAAIDQGFDSEIQEIVRGILAAADPSLVKGLLTVLVARMRLAEAESVIAASGGEKGSLLLAAFSSEVASRAGNNPGTALEEYCASIASAWRWQALNEFGEVEALREIGLSSATIERVRLALKGRYLSWREEIASELVQRSPEHAITREKEKRGIYIGVGCAIWAVAFVVLSAFSLSDFGCAGGALLGAALPLAWYANARTANIPKALSELQDVEARHWAAVLR